VPPIQDELPNKHSNILGTVAMCKIVNSSGAVIPNSASDQFYINLADNSAYLNASYTVFGMVISGMNVVDAISQLIPSGSNATGYDGPPSTPVTIITAQFVG
jgi:cyclophilin family peptidyl-prolyl cis-trans isomerase